MFIHTEESLQEFEDYIEQLEEKVGLTPETYKEVKTAISKERTKLKNLAISGVSNSVCPSEYCQSKNQKVCNGYCMHKSETPPRAN